MHCSASEHAFPKEVDGISMAGHPRRHGAQQTNPRYGNKVRRFLHPNVTFHNSLSTRALVVNSLIYLITPVPAACSVEFLKVCCYRNSLRTLLM
jgi:hypothetical protein